MMVGWQEGSGAGAATSDGAIAAAIDALLHSAIYSPGQQTDAPPRARFPGGVLSVKKGGISHVVSGGVAATTGKAPPQPDARFPIGCFGKVLTASIALDLVRRGQMSLDDPVGRSLSELSGCAFGAIPVRHLLTHAGGFREAFGFDARWEFSWNDLVAAFRAAPVLFAPGSVWSYSQTGHAVVEKVIERATGRCYEELRNQLMADILGYQPLERDDYQRTHAVPHIFLRDGFTPFKYPKNRGALRNTISDLALTVAELCTIYETLLAREPSLLEGATGDAPTVTIPPAGGGFCTECLPDGYYASFGQYGGQFGNNGSYMGVTCAVRCDLKSGSVAAIGLNAWFPDAREAVVRGALELSANPEAVVFPRNPVLPGDAADFTVDELVGSYHGLMYGQHRATIDENGHCRIETQGFTANAVGVLEGQVVSNPHGGVTFRTQSGRAFGAFRDPSSGIPVLRFGLSAFARNRQS